MSRIRKGDRVVLHPAYYSEELCKEVYIVRKTDWFGCCHVTNEKATGPTFPTYTFPKTDLLPAPPKLIRCYSVRTPDSKPQYITFDDIDDLVNMIKDRVINLPVDGKAKFKIVVQELSMEVIDNMPEAE